MNTGIHEYDLIRRTIVIVMHVQFQLSLNGEGMYQLSCAVVLHGACVVEY